MLLICLTSCFASGILPGGCHIPHGHHHFHSSRFEQPSSQGGGFTGLIGPVISILPWLHSLFASSSAPSNPAARTTDQRETPVASSQNRGKSFGQESSIPTAEKYEKAVQMFVQQNTLDGLDQLNCSELYEAIDYAKENHNRHPNISLFIDFARDQAEQLLTGPERLTYRQKNVPERLLAREPVRPSNLWQREIRVQEICLNYGVQPSSFGSLAELRKCVRGHAIKWHTDKNPEGAAMIQQNNDDVAALDELQKRYR